MKKNNLTKYAFLPLLAIALGFLQGCKEDIDMSDRYTFKEYTIASYLTEHDTTYSEYIDLLQKVKISHRSKSTVFQLMSARGKYTMFAPTNKAIHNYLDTLCAKGIISEPSWDGFPDDHTLDSIQKIIVYNSILDGTKDDIDPIQSGSFPEDGFEFNIPNMNERKLTIAYDKNPDSVYVSGVKDKQGNIIKGCLIDLKNRDIYTINGYIHQVHSVVAPSNETLADLLQSYIDENTGDYIVAAKMMLATGLTDTLTKVKDEVYEDMKLNEDPRLANIGDFKGNKNSGDLPEHRYYGYTLFAETDDFWRATLGKEPKDISVADIQAWVVSQGFYPDAKDDTNYKDEDNALNQFFTYHILPERLPANKLVIHYNEKGYTYKDKNRPFTVPIYEIWTTMGKRRLMKIYQAGPRYCLDGVGRLYINRFPVLNNGRRDDYSEKSITPETEGIVIDTENAIDLINAYIYPIDKPLVYDLNVRTNLQKQRIRFDLTTITPEFANNDLRGTTLNLYTGMPIDDNYKYMENIDLLKGTQFYYLSGYDNYWFNWQGDEFNVRGTLEMIFKLPPVPMPGTYEVRFAVQSNSNLRGMCQVYFGKDKGNLPAMGLPLDIRQAGTYRALASGNVPSTLVGWEQDIDDDDYNAEVDKKMRNNGFMKGPALYECGAGSGQVARTKEQKLRRILVREYLYPENTYYLKFKSVLDAMDKEFYMDYFEICSKEVYDNPMTPEDIW